VKPDKGEEEKKGLAAHGQNRCKSMGAAKLQAVSFGSFFWLDPVLDLIRTEDR
jgi:hypothetical protein